METGLIWFRKGPVKSPSKHGRSDEPRNESMG